MAGSDENLSREIRPLYPQGIGQTRRALSTLNGNILGAPRFPFVFHKEGAFKEKFAVKMTTKQQLQPLVQETKPPCPSDISRSASDDYIIDVEGNYKTSDDYPVPMSVQHTEAFLDEIDQMDDEVEMQDIAEETVVDIDRCDKGNPLAVVEYINDIYAHYKRTEESSYPVPDYMGHQFGINERMRGILIDWLIEVHYKFELLDETLYLTVSLIDRYLAVKQIERKKLQLVGVTAMLLACKYEEVSVPVIEDLILISDKAYTRNEVLEMENSMINTLQFNMSVPTPYVFMRRFLKAAQSDKQLELLSFFMVELCLVEYEMLKFPPSLLAAAAIFTAQCSLCGFKLWNKTCETHTSYTQDQLLDCSKLMVTFHKKACEGKLTSVHKKYSTSKYGYAARPEPALFLLDANY